MLHVGRKSRRDTGTVDTTGVMLTPVVREELITVAYGMMVPVAADIQFEESPLPETIARPKREGVGLLTLIKRLFGFDDRKKDSAARGDAAPGVATTMDQPAVESPPSIGDMEAALLDNIQIDRTNLIELSGRRA